jgi:hypothetical protein
VAIEPLADPPTAARLGLPRAVFIIPGLGLTFVGLFVGQALLRARFLGVAPHVHDLLVESCTRWLLYAALAPVVGLLVARVPLERGHLARRWPVHILATLGFAFTHNAAMGIIYRIFHVYPRQDSLLQAMGHLAVTYFAVNVVIFGAISGVYHSIRYHLEIVKRETIAAELRARLIESRLDSLRDQLNPHFLFNTLNAATSLVLSGERDQVVHVLSRLSDLLRISLDRKLPQEIPLALELELLARYLDIQRTRFGERLTVVTDSASDAQLALLPSMMLQPLVENALGHGIEARSGPGHVAITVKRRGAALDIRIEDSGPGFAPPPRPSRNGIGLANTRARLEQLYGDAQSLEFGNLPEGGAFVHVTLPFHAAADDSDGPRRANAAGTAPAVGEAPPAEPPRGPA